jgi:hypothetical protein
MAANADADDAPTVPQATHALPAGPFRGDIVEAVPATATKA